MTEILFYQLLRQPLEAVLPVLLMRSLAKKWNAVVQGASEERMRALDDHLWTFSEESFLPHGLASQNDAGKQPVILTCDTSNPNQSQIRFLIDNVDEPDNVDSYERIAVLFDGRFESSLKQAREQWKRCRNIGQTVTYWAQNENGRWEKKA